MYLKKIVNDIQLEIHKFECKNKLSCNDIIG